MMATLEQMVDLGSLGGQDGVRRHVWESSHDCEIVAGSGWLGHLILPGFRLEEDPLTFATVPREAIRTAWV